MGAVALLEAVDRAQRQRAQQSSGPQLAQLNAADPSRGFSTPYYAAYTNSGDLAAAFNAADGQKVRLVDPKTGQVYAEGVGSQGAQQIATLATQLGNDLGRKAQWQIQTQNPDDTYTTVGYDRYDPKSNLLKSIVRIAAPLLGAAIPGIGPLLGAALGGAGGTLATGGNLREALLAGATSALGNSLGGALSGALRGAPVSFAGTNPLGGAFSTLRAGGSLSDALLGGVGTDAITGGVELSPLTIMGNAGGGGIANSLLSGLGSAAGSVVASGLGTDRFTGDNIGNDSIVTGQQQPTATTAPGQEPTTLDTVTIEGTSPNSLGYVDLKDIAYSSINNSAWARGQRGETTTADRNTLDFLADTVGQAGGGLTADMVGAGLANLLNLMPQPNLDGVADAGYDDAPNVGPKTGTVVDPYMPNAGDSAVLPDTVGPKPPPVANDMGGAGGVPSAAGGGGGGGGGLFNAQNPGAAAPAPSTAGTDIDTEGGFAPDIYPWRKAMMAQ